MAGAKKTIRWAAGVSPLHRVACARPVAVKVIVAKRVPQTTVVFTKNNGCFVYSTQVFLTNRRSASILINVRVVRGTHRFPPGLSAPHSDLLSGPSA